MNKFLLLLKNYLKMDFKFNTKGNKKLSGRMKALYVFCFAYLAIIFALFSYLMASSYAPVFAKADLEPQFFGIVCLIAQAVMLIFGFALFIGRLYVSNDNEKIGFMPLTANQKFWAKFMATYIWLFAINFIILLFAFIGYIVSVGFNGWMILGFLIALLVGPMFSMLIASIITVIIMPIYNVLKKNKIVLSVVAIGAICVAIYYYFKFFSSDWFGVDENEIVLSNYAINVISTICNIFYFNLVIGKVIAGGLMPLDVLIFVGIIAVLVLLNVFIAKHIVEQSEKKTYETSESGIKNQIGFGGDLQKTIMKKEFLSMVRFPSLMIYCSASLILPPIFLVFFTNLTQFAPEFQALIVFAIVTFMGAGLQYFALSSFTREGEQFYLTKTLPISLKKLADIKVSVACAVSLITQVICIIVCLFVTTMPWYMYFVVFGLSIVVSTAMVYFDVLIDAKTPRLVWESIYVAMQNNMNVLKSMIVSSLYTIILGVVFFILLSTVSFDLCLIVTWSLAWVLGILLFFYAKKLYNANVEKYLNDVE